MGQWAHRSLGQLELNACEPVAAEEALRASYQVLVEMDLKGSLSESCVLLGDALLSQGRIDEAAEMLASTKEEWASGDASTEAPRLAVQARLLAAEGKAAEARATSEQALRLVRSTDWTCLHADVLLAAVEVLRAGGPENEEAADAALREAVRIAAGKGYEAAVARARAVDETAAEPARSS
jgi:ATP/maltotriose-dependent transcriptional regulator MalT